MKLKKISTLIALVLLSANTSCAVGSETGNGGDPCENRFKIIRDDISLWIKKGGSAELNLYSTSLNYYNNKMNQQLAEASVSCTDDKVLVGSAEKTCKNYLDQSGTPQILCNNTRFMNASEADQYVLVHHEYAGLSGIEANDGSNSNYDISNQLTAYLENQIIKKLAITKKSAPVVFEPLPSGTENLSLDQFSENKVALVFKRNIALNIACTDTSDLGRVSTFGLFNESFISPARNTAFGCSLLFAPTTPNVNVITGNSPMCYSNTHKFLAGDYFLFQSGAINLQGMGHSKNVIVDGTFFTTTGYAIAGRLDCGHGSSVANDPQTHFPLFQEVMDGIKLFGEISSVKQ